MLIFRLIGVVGIRMLVMAPIVVLVLPVLFWRSCGCRFFRVEVFELRITYWMNSLCFTFFLKKYILHAVSGFPPRVLCAAKHGSVIGVKTKATESAIVVNRNTPVVCFSTSCLWPLWRVSLQSVLRLGGGEKSILSMYRVANGIREWFM